MAFPSRESPLAWQPRRRWGGSALVLVVCGSPFPSASAPAWQRRDWADGQAALSASLAWPGSARRFLPSPPSGRWRRSDARLARAELGPSRGSLPAAPAEPRGSRRSGEAQRGRQGRGRGREKGREEPPAGARQGERLAGACLGSAARRREKVSRRAGGLAVEGQGVSCSGLLRRPCRSCWRRGGGGGAPSRGAPSPAVQPSIKDRSGPGAGLAEGLGRKERPRCLSSPSSLPTPNMAAVIATATTTCLGGFGGNGSQCGTLLWRVPSAGSPLFLAAFLLPFVPCPAPRVQVRSRSREQDSPNIASSAHGSPERLHIASCPIL